MDENLRGQIKSNLNLRETNDLVEIWQQQNTDEWEEETFEIIREILITRLGYIPDLSIPTQLKLIFQRIEDLREANDYSKALDECNKAVHLAPENAIAHHYRGIILDDLKFFEQALSEYREAVRLDPDFEDARENLVSLENELENETKQDSETQYQGFFNREQFSTKSAFSEDSDLSNDLREQIKNNFEILETGILVRIWKIHDTNEWTEEAFEVLREILLQRLGSVPKLAVQTEIDRIFERINDLRAAKAFSMAMTECKQAARLANSDPKVHYYFGLVHEDLSEPGKALSCYQKAISLYPDYEEALYKLNKLEKGIEKQYKKSKSKSFLKRAMDYAEDEEFDAALSEIEMAKQDLPKIAAAYNDYGLALQSARKVDEAIEAFLEAIRLNPHFSGVHTNLRNARVQQEEARNIAAAEESVTDVYGEQDLTEGFTEKGFEEKQRELIETPAWLYMDKTAHLVKGTSGHRTRPGRSGYDPLDSPFEEARFEGSLLRKIFTGKYRTRDPLYLILNTIFGLVFSFPLLLSVASLQKSYDVPIIFFFTFLPLGIVGAAILINVILSFFSKKPKEADDKGENFY